MRTLLNIILLFLIAPLPASAQDAYSGEVQFQVFDVNDEAPITRSYAFDEAYVHLSLADPKEEMMVNILMVKESKSSYVIEGDSTSGFTLKKVKFPRKRAAARLQLFREAIPLGETKEIDGMKAELYYVPFAQDSVIIWFTKEIDFDGKKYLPQDAMFEDFFVQMLNADYGFPLEFSSINRKGEETHFTKAKWIRKRLPKNYFSYMEANAREIDVVDNFSVEDFDLPPPEEPPLLEESPESQRSGKSTIQITDLVMEEEPEPVMEMEEDEIFMIAEEMPQFPEGRQAMIEFVNTRIKYPEAAKKLGAEGLVVVQFVVQKDGNFRDIEILRDPGHGMGEEAKRIVESMPQWTPGKLKGKPVNILYKLPVRFKLPK